MDVLAVIHGKSARAGVFGDVVAERGHRLEEWSLAWDTPPPRPLDAYGAVLVFGGAMHADQDDRHYGGTPPRVGATRALRAHWRRRQNREDIFGWHAAAA